MIGLRFDLRVPPFASTTHATQYAACLDLCSWGEEHGVDFVALSEHHGVEDGFMCAPVTLAAAIAGRTRRLPINIAAVLVPLHDPVRLAEQLATVSLLSGNRISLIAGVGYRDEEFAMAGIERKQRAKLLEENIQVMRQAWTGAPFEWRGRTIRVTPKPTSPPLIMIGGSTPIAARRAARLHCGFSPAIGDADLVQIYEDECRKVGFQAGFCASPGGPGFVHVSDNPTRDWERIAPHAMYDAETYHAWQTPDQRPSQVHVHATTLEELKASGVYRVLTPEQCVALYQKEGRVLLHPLMGGLPPELGWEGVRLFAQKVLPRIR